MTKEQKLDELLDRFKSVVAGKGWGSALERFTTYAITNFRGGIGKSTLASSTWHGVSLEGAEPCVMDACPQCNFSQSLLGEDIEQNPYNIYDACYPT